MSRPLEIRISGDFPAALARADATLLVSAYHAGKLLLLDLDERARLRLTPVAYRKPMGIATAPGALAVATLDELHVYADCPPLAEHAAPGGRFSHVFFPRLTWHCGPLDLHDLCFVGDELWAVNTLFSCLCSFDAAASFRPRWVPPFISALEPQDRCHLNGLALEDGVPRYVTALGAGDEPGSWRAQVTSGGVLMRLPDGEELCEGLAMPHSPRLAGGALWLLQSVTGALTRVDPRDGSAEEVVVLDGMVRGLCLRNGVAFVGVSRARAQSPTFALLDARAKVENAAIHAIDLASGALLGSLVFTALVEEIYDIQALPGRAPTGILGLYDERRRQAVWTPERAYWRRLPPEVRSEGRSGEQESSDGAVDGACNAPSLNNN